MDRSTKFRESAAPPTRTGRFTPARERSWAVVTICWALFTSRPGEPEDVRAVLAHRGHQLLGRES